MKNYLFIITLFFSFGLITAQEDDGVANGASYIQVDYIKTVPGKNYGQILNEKWAKLAEKRILELL